MNERIVSPKSPTETEKNTIFIVEMVLSLLQDWLNVIYPLAIANNTRNKHDSNKGPINGSIDNNI